MTSLGATDIEVFSDTRTMFVLGLDTRNSAGKTPLEAMYPPCASLLWRRGMLEYQESLGPENGLKCCFNEPRVSSENSTRNNGFE